VNFVSACTLCEDKDLHRADPPSDFFLVLVLRTSTCVDCHSALVGYCQQSSASQCTKQIRQRTTLNEYTGNAGGGTKDRRITT